MKVAIVIPTYNEGERLVETLSGVLEHFETVVVVDDGSRDKSFEWAKESGAYALRHVVNRGQGAALQTGVDFAVQELNADIVVHFDADGQMDVHEIKEIIKPIQNGEVEIVFGSRFLGKALNMPTTRKITLMLSRVFTKLVSGISLTDAHCGFRALSKNAAKRARFTLDRQAHASQIYDLVKIHSLTYKEVPVTIRYTDETLAKGMKFTDGFGVLKDFFKHKFFG